MPKLRDVIGGTETKTSCQATVCRTCVLAVPRTIRMGLTTIGNQIKLLEYSVKRLFFLQMYSIFLNVRSPTSIHSRQRHSRD